MYNEYVTKAFVYKIYIRTYKYITYIFYLELRINFLFPIQKKSGKIRKTKIKKTLTSYLQTLPL